MRVSRFHPPPPYALTPSRSSSRHLVFFSTHPLFPSGFLSPHRGSTGSPTKAELATICCFLETKFSRVRSDTEIAFASRVAAGASFWRGCPFSVAGRFCVRKRTACAVAFASPTPDPAPLNPPSHCGAFGSPAFAEIVFRDGRGKREDRPRKQTWRHRGRAGGFARFDRVESIPERVVPLPPPPPGRSERFASALVVEEVVVGPFGNGKWRRGGAMSD